jgi:hypothetical protein
MGSKTSRDLDYSAQLVLQNKWAQFDLSWRSSAEFVHTPVKMLSFFWAELKKY